MECSAARDTATLDDLKPRPVKATLLSWLAKAGNFSMSERGSTITFTSALNYARRNFIPILVKVAMLKGIVASTFNADAQPSGIARAPI